MLDYTTHMDAPELVEVCQNCKHADCVGLCLEYKNAFRRLMGAREIGTERVKKDVRATGTRFTAFGKTRSLSEWAKETGISYYTLYKRIKLEGWDTETALTRSTKAGPTTKIILKARGREMSVNDWAVETGVSYQTIYARLNRGWTDEEAIFGRQA